MTQPIQRRMGEKRGQAAIEYIILIGVLLVFLIPVVYYSLNQSSTQVRMSQLENAVKRLAKTADAMQGIGIGAHDVVVITLPQGVEEVEVGNYTINLKVSMAGGISDIGMPTKANITGSFPSTPGTYRILLQHLNTGVVNVSLKP
jgi:uncharacterized protein (UPF0333 family)